MGIVDAIKGKFGKGSEHGESRSGRLRQPPGTEGPSNGPELGPRQGSRGDTEFDSTGRSSGGGPGREPPREGPQNPSRDGPRDPPRERPGSGRGGRGSTLDIDREDGPATDGGGTDEFDFQPPGDGPDGPGGGPSRADAQGRDETPERRTDRNPGPAPRSDQRREERGDDLPDAPRDYNLDLPAPREEGDRLDRIEEQNEMIIDILQDIRDNVGGRRRR